MYPTSTDLSALWLRQRHGPHTESVDSNHHEVADENDVTDENGVTDEDWQEETPHCEYTEPYYDCKDGAVYEIFENTADCESETKMCDCLEGCGGAGVSTQSALPECCDGAPTELCWNCVYDEFKFCAESHEDEPDASLESTDGGITDTLAIEDSAGDVGPDPADAVAEIDDAITDAGK